MSEATIEWQGQARTLKVRTWLHSEKLRADEDSGLRRSQAALAWYTQHLDEVRIQLQPDVYVRVLERVAEANDAAAAARTEHEILRVAACLESPKLTAAELRALPQDVWERVVYHVDAQLQRFDDRLMLFMGRLAQILPPDTFKRIEDEFQAAFRPDALKNSSGT